MLLRVFIAALWVLLACSNGHSQNITTPHDWSGVYVGGQINRIKGSIDIYDNPRSPLIGAPGYLPHHEPLSHHLSLVSGINWQIENLVIGAEGTYHAAKFGDRTLLINAFNLPFSATTTISHLTQLGGRIGVNIDGLYVYSEAGYASANIKFENLLGPVFQKSGHLNGYYIGAGIEWVFNEHWIVGIEYNRIRFSDLAIVGHPFGAPRSAILEKLNFNKFGIHLAYKF